MSDYKLDVEVAVSGDSDARERLKTLEKFIEQTRARAAALNRLKISPAVAIDDRISAPLRSIRVELERAGSMYGKFFRNAGTAITNIRKMFLENLNLQLDVTGKLLVEHKVVAFINTLGRNNTASEGEYPSRAANKNDDSLFGTMKNGIDTFNKIWSGFSEGIKMGDSKIPQKITGYATKAGGAITKAVKTVGGTRIGDRTLGEIGSGVVSFGKRILGGAAEGAGGLLKGVSNVANTVSEAKVGKKTLGEIGSGVVSIGKKAFDGVAEGAGDLFKGYSKIARRVPYLGQAIDVFNIATSDEKTKTAIQAVGGTGGAMAGAALGAALGSVVPVVGTVFGGILGGIAGSFGGDWLAEKAVDQVRSRFSEEAANSHSNDGMLMLPVTHNIPEGNKNNAGNQGGITQNLTVNVTVDSDMDRAELAKFVAERIAAEVRKIMQNTTPAAVPALGG